MGMARSRTKMAGKSDFEATTDENISTDDVMNLRWRSLRCRPQSAQMVSSHLVSKVRFSGVWTTVAKRRVTHLKKNNLYDLGMLFYSIKPTELDTGRMFNFCLSWFVKYTFGLVVSSTPTLQKCYLPFLEWSFVLSGSIFHLPKVNLVFNLKLVKVHY